MLMDRVRRLRIDMIKVSGIIDIDPQFSNYHHIPSPHHILCTSSNPILQHFLLPQHSLTPSPPHSITSQLFDLFPRPTPPHPPPNIRLGMAYAAARGHGSAYGQANAQERSLKAKGREVGQEAVQGKKIEGKRVDHLGIEA